MWEQHKSLLLHLLLHHLLLPPLINLLHLLLKNLLYHQKRKRKKVSSLINLDIKFDLLIYDGELNVEKIDNWIRQVEVYYRIQKIVKH